MQKNGKLVLPYLIGCLIVCNALAVINLHKKATLISVCSVNWRKSQQKNIDLTNYFIEREKKCVESENFSLPGQLALKGFDSNTYYLKEKVNQSPVLFFVSPVQIAKLVLIQKFKKIKIILCIG